MGNPKGMVFMGMGFELVVMVLGAAYFGQMVDEKMKWNGMFTASLIVGSLVIWFYHLLILLKKVNAEDDSENQ